MGAAEFHQRDREAATGVLGNERHSEGQDSDTLRARIATELRAVERLQRIARPVALIVFALLGLLVVLQLYTWTRLEQLTTLSQQRDERVTAAQAAMQEAIEKQRMAPSRTVQQPVSERHTSPKADLPARENGDHGKASPAHARAKLSKANNAPQLERRAEASPGTDQSVPEQQRTVAAGQMPSRAISATGQNSTIVYQSPAVNRSSNHQETSALPSSQALLAHPGAESGPIEQRDGGESSGVRLSQADTVIARDHNDIERLRKVGKRDYVEFTLVRSGSRQEVAPDISLQLRKVDSKRLRCALSVYSEGYEFPTDLGINEPVVFPVRAMWESVELVINKVGKDTVGGYLTARKGVLMAR
jgi:Tfp pilus assembly protein PilX